MREIWEGLLAGLGSALSLFYDLIPSYGVAIILLTAVVNVLLFPLTLKQTRATRAFQKIQPEVRRIQKEYKEDPQAMQQEMMRLQREAGASPGGCLLPIIVQMPVWFALFRVLNAPLTYIPAGSGLATLIASGNGRFLSMDLGLQVSAAVARAAASQIWEALPYLGMLVVMVGAQYVQMAHAQPRSLARSPDPQVQAQQRIAKIMPPFFGVISYFWPAGLVLYWTTSSIFRFLQQVVIYRIDGRPEPITGAAPGPTDVKVGRPQAPANRRKRRRRK